MNFRTSIRIASDYNRTLAAPIRWAHVLAAILIAPFEPIVGWVYAPGRRWISVPYTWAIVLFAACLPLDGPISRLARTIRLGGDVKREMETWQQYGAIGSLLFTAAVIWLLDEKNRRRLLDLAAAVISVGLVVTALKMLVGRPRPRELFDDPGYFLGPFGAYPVNEHAGVRHAWEFWSGISSDLWSMPSSHTAYAVTLSCFLLSLYPKLFPVAVFMPIFVGFSRVLFGAHYLTDVVVGAIAAYPIASRAVACGWGVHLGRLLSKQPAPPATQHEHEGQGSTANAEPDPAAVSPAP